MKEADEVYVLDTGSTDNISITAPAVKVTITLPLYIDPTPTDRTLEITVSGIFVPLFLTAKVTVVPFYG